MRFVKLLLTVSCGVAMFLPAGCRPAPAVQPLHEEPPAKVHQIAARDSYYEVGQMTTDDAAELEAQLKKNPEDLDARQTLLVFYGPDFTGNVAARRPHILWLIEHHPDHPIAGSWEARIFPKAPDPVPDADGYARAKKLWLKHTANPNAGVAVLSNAAAFLEVADKPLAEELLLRGEAKAPYADWASSLGQLYATAIVGSVGGVRMSAVQSVSVEEARTPFAISAREKLSTSKDVQLLGEAGTFLIHATRQVARKLDFDPVALGRSYLQRALELNPESTQARSALASLAQSERTERLMNLLKGVPKE